MGKQLYIVIIIMIVCSSCTGRNPRQIAITQDIDYEMTCETLMDELRYIEQEVKRISPGLSTAGKNTAFIFGGLFFFPAIFLIDIKGGEKYEYEGFRLRYEHLLILGREKGCIGIADKYSMPALYDKIKSINAPTKHNMMGSVNKFLKK